MIITKIPSEHDEQVMLVKWLKLKKIRYSSTPNGGFRNAREAKRLKEEGVSKGFPDITIFLQDKCLFIEMKRIKGSTTSKEQKEWLGYLNGLNYAHGKICRGFKEAKEFVEAHL